MTKIKKARRPKGLVYKKKNNNFPPINHISSPYSIFCSLCNINQANQIALYYLWSKLSEETKQSFCNLFLKQYQNIVDNDYLLEDDNIMSLCSPIKTIESHHLPYISEKGGYPSIYPFLKFIMQIIEKYGDSWDEDKSEFIAIQLTEHWNELSSVDKEKYSGNY